MTITELAPAKLNLTLDVGARRPDGYHEITSPGRRRTSFFRRQISSVQGFLSDWRRKSPPRPVLEAVAVTPPPYCEA